MLVQTELVLSFLISVQNTTRILLAAESAGIFYEVCKRGCLFRHRTVRLPFNGVGRRSMPPTPVQRCCTVQWRTCTECEFFDCKQNHSRATRYMISTFAFCPFFPLLFLFLPDVAERVHEHRLEHTAMCHCTTIHILWMVCIVMNAL